MLRICIVILTLIVAQPAMVSSVAAEAPTPSAETEPGGDRMINLFVFYPQPTDSDVFDSAYKGHAKLIKEKTGKPFVVSKSIGDAEAFYQVFTMSFSSIEELEAVLTPTVREELDADAFRISTGGQPIIMVTEAEKHD